MVNGTASDRDRAGAGVPSILPTTVLELHPTLLLPSKREGKLSCFEWSPDGAWIAEVRGKLEGIRVWSLAGSVPHVGPIAAVPGLVEVPSSQGSLRWSPDGRGLSISAAGMVRVFDVGQDGALTQRWASACAPSKRVRTAWRPDGSALAIGLGDRVVLLDAQTGERTFDLCLRLASHDSLDVLEWNPAGNEVAAGAWGGMFGVDVETREITIDLGAQMAIGARWWSPDLLYVGADRQVLAWNPLRQEAAAQIILDGAVCMLSLSADRTLAAVMLRGRLVLLRTPPPRYGPKAPTLEIVADMTLPGVKHPVGVWAEFHPTLPWLATHTGNAASIQVYEWDPATL
jgi:WD40 repeat protein